MFIRFKGNIIDVILLQFLNASGGIEFASKVKGAKKKIASKMHKPKEKDGYYSGNPLKRDKDQELGQMKHDIQTKGKWFRPGLQN